MEEFDSLFADFDVKLLPNECTVNIRSLQTTYNDKIDPIMKLLIKIADSKAIDTRIENKVSKLEKIQTERCRSKLMVERMNKEIKEINTKLECLNDKELKASKIVKSQDEKLTSMRKAKQKLDEEKVVNNDIQEVKIKIVSHVCADSNDNHGESVINTQTYNESKVKKQKDKKSKQKSYCMCSCS